MSDPLKTTILVLTYIFNIVLVFLYGLLILLAIQVPHLKLIIAISVLMIIANISWLVTMQIMYDSTSTQ
jgi:hypothetical protein